MKRATESPTMASLRQSINDTQSTAWQSGNHAFTQPSPAPFPIGVFPQPIQWIIEQTRDHANFPADYTATGILFAASVAIGRSHRLAFSSNWQESAVLYAALIGPPGANKSHPLHFALKPILSRDGEHFQEFTQQQHEWEVATGEEKGTRPILQKHLVSDFTPEVLAKIHQDNPHGLGVYVDELASWFGNFNRYNKGSEQEFWLSNWSGKPLIKDRLNSNSFHIANPFISVAGTIQPSRLQAIGKNGRDLNGFTDRILFAYPETTCQPWPETQLSEEVAIRWAEIIHKLMEREIGDNKDSHGSRQLDLHPAAMRVLRIWQASNADKINNTDEPGIKGMLSKLDIHLLRLCLILQLLRWACGGHTRSVVEEETAQAAIDLIEYFREHGERANALITGSDPTKAFTQRQRQVYDALPTQFKTGEGVQVAARFGMKERTFKSWLNDKRLFTKIEHGLNEKII